VSWKSAKAAGYCICRAVRPWSCLDGFLLETASSHIDPEVRVRLIKFYAMFKIVEMLRYERFRGFPA